MKHYVVTGGAGFIGSHLVDELISEGHRVTVIDDFSSGRAENLSQHAKNKHVTIHHRSVCEDLSDIFQNNEFDGVFHLAAMLQVEPSIKQPVQYNHVNVNGTLYLLELCRKFNVKRFVFTSSCALYGDPKELPTTESSEPNPLSPYAAQKMIGEHYCKLYNEIYNMETVMLRYFNVYGPRQTTSGYAGLIPAFMSKLLNNEAPTIFGDGENSRDFVYVEDVAKANIAASQSDNKEIFGTAINVGSGSVYTVNEISKNIVELSNKPIKPNKGKARIEPKSAQGDITKAKELLDWKPEKYFEQGLLETFNYFKKEHDTLNN